MEKKSVLAQRFGAHVRELRLERGLSQEELAFGCARSLNYTSEIETGKRNPTLDTIGPICAALGVKMSDMLAAVGE